MSRTIFPFDEINAFRTRLVEFHIDPETGRIKSRRDCEDIIDEMLDLYLLAYANGVRSINEQFGTDIEPDTEDIERTVFLPVDGDTWESRVWDCFAGVSANGTEDYGSVDDIMRIVETEAHRDGNTAADDTAVKAGAQTKTWRTMLDEKVRSTHSYLESMTVPVDSDFYTYDGDHARAPGLFALPENNINCRCELEYN